MLIYMIGINGSGMLALYNILKERENIIGGSDYNLEFSDFKLDSLDEIKENENYTYIISNAYINNSKVKYIRSKYKTYLYHEFIASYFKEYRFICVSGSHGKTTTTSFLSSLLANYSYICGDQTSRLKNKTMILESCEYKRSFLNYTPNILVILSLDYDHPDCYESESDYIDSYIKLANKSDVVVINGDDKNSRLIKHNNKITFGLNKNCDYNFEYKINKNKSIVYFCDRTYELSFVGLNYIYDFVCSLIVSLLEGVDVTEEMVEKLKLPKRRLETKSVNGKTYIADYAHHPNEIDYLYQTLEKMYDLDRLLFIFEPHTLTRLNKFKSEFRIVLNKLKNVLLLPVFYSPREIEDEVLEKTIYEYIGIKRVTKEDITKETSRFDVIVMCGAGSIYDEYLKF